jgi:hypothetical protein
MTNNIIATELIDAADLTPMCQNPPDSVRDFTVAGLVAALEHAWAAIRTRHPEVPNAIIVLGSGSPTKASQALKWGHFASLRWQHGGTRLPEVLVSGEGLKRTPQEVFTTLLHEATHGLADARNIQDTSRQGRWHNKRFAKLAAELGMTTTRDDRLGFSPCTLTDQTAATYQPVIARIGDALGAWRHPELHAEGKQRTNNNGLACQCECPRKLRLSQAVFDAGPVICGVCADAFLPEHIDRDTYNTEHAALLAINTSPTSPVMPTAIPTGKPADQPDEKGDPMVFYDPTGARYGLPTYPYKFAPNGLATRRQLRDKGLRPGGQDIAAQILWRNGKRVAYLYRIDLAQPKRAATAAQLAAIHRAITARRTCPTCRQVRDYCIPRRYGECLDCHHTPAGTTTNSINGTDGHGRSAAR